MCTSYFKVKVTTHQWIAKGSAMSCCCNSSDFPVHV